MIISIIIVTYNTKELLERCLEHLFQGTSRLHPDCDRDSARRISSLLFERSRELPFELEIIVVDNASTDGTQEWISDFRFQISDFCFIRNEVNVGFAKAVNQGIAKSRGEYILLLNTDAFITQGQIVELVDSMRRIQTRQIGIVAPRLQNRDGSIQPSYGHFPSIGGLLLYLFRLEKLLPWGTVVHPNLQSTIFNLQSVDWVSGACMLVKREVIDRIGPFDEQYFFGIEDMDFCMRARRAGYAVVVDPSVSVLHYHQYTAKKTQQHRALVRGANENLIYFYKKFHPTRRVRGAIFTLLAWMKMRIQSVVVS